MMTDSAKSKIVLRSAKETSVSAAVRECMEQCGWEQVVSPNATVVIKPNLCTSVKEVVVGGNTNVAVIRAVCEVLLSRTRRIIIGESGHLRQSPEDCFPVSGYTEMARELGIELVNFSNGPFVRKECPPAGEINMPRLLFDADVYINIPVLKTHALTYFTCSLKNQWGCVPDCHDRLRFHKYINPMLSSLQKMLQPKLIIVDALYAMEGRGPVAGPIRRLDLVLGGRDAVAVDATAMRLVGLDPARARHVVMAAEAGLGHFPADEIEVDGDWEGLKTQFEAPPRDVANRAMFFVTQYPWFVKNILANDRIYYPIRDFVKFLRRAKVLGG
jgi:uncharacterized protein (DUF362 family)